MVPLNEEIEQKTQAALTAFYDRGKGLFVGYGKRISYMDNVWFCLAEVFSKEERAKLLTRLEKQENAVKPVTPYAYHYYVQVLMDCGLVERGFALINEYWGGMVTLGADTFFECFDPNAPEKSPYGNAALNSYCHAWGCTPAYFFRKYGGK